MPVRYWFYFATQDKAEKASYFIRPLVDFVSIRLAASGRQWLLFAIVKLDNSPETRRNQWEDIAASVDGEYDGWDSNNPPSFTELVAESMGG